MASHASRTLRSSSNGIATTATATANAVWLTLGFENNQQDPVSLSINRKTVGQDLYDELFDMGIQAEAIMMYNSRKADKLYEDDNVLELLESFEQKTRTSREHPLLSIKLKSGRSDTGSVKKPSLGRTSSIAREKQCIVFDFDCTLTKRHWYHFNNSLTTFIQIYSAPGPAYVDFDKVDIFKLRDDYRAGDEDATKQVVELIWGGYKRIEMLKEFLTTVKDKYEYDLFVSSRGLVVDIEKGLDLIDIRDLFKNYQGTASPQRLGRKIRNQPSSCDNPKTKVDFILNCLYDSNYFDVIYIDDDSSEHVTISRLLPKTKWVEEDRRYYFVPGLKKDVGGGIEQPQIDELYHLVEEVVTSG